MNLGSHMSVAGGVWNAVEKARGVTANTLQIFVKAPRTWRGKPVDDEGIRRFREALEEFEVSASTVHHTYLLNIASPKPDLRQKSRECLQFELEQAEALGIPYTVLHPGSAKDTTLDDGIANICAELDAIHETCSGFTTKILLENTAGGGNTIGRSFEELRQILDGVKAPERLGVCLDTCHLYAAGYDLRTPEAYAETMSEFDRIVGVDQVKAWHLNDSQGELGSNKDRHAGIGEGCIGDGGFRELLADTRFATIPMILETPKDDGADDRNLARLRSLRD